MKPRTKLDCEVMNLSKNYILPLTTKQSEYAKQKCFDKFAKSTTKGTITCLECGHKWEYPSKPKKVTCPQCSAKMRVEVTRKMKWSESNHFGVLDNVGGYQVLRTFYIERHLKEGDPVHYYICEVIQRFLTSEKKEVIVARARNMNCYSVGWSWGSDLEIRKNRSFGWSSEQRYKLGVACICPGYEVPSDVLRNGFKGECYGIEPFELFRHLLYDSKAETLLKTKQGSLLYNHIHGRDTSQYWRSICICNRNNYIVKDAKMWIDYLSMLDTEGKDILNAKYVCPKNLKKAHDDLSAKIQVRRARERKENNRLKAINAEQKFKELKARYFGVAIVEGEMQIKVLDTIDAYIEEGAVMHHCVCSAEYYLKPDTLILSATVKGERVETVELSLKTLKVVQSRGICNSTTDHHAKIVNLVNHKIASQIKNRISV